jgi:membrane protease YdiL (CAAX protease family)
MSALVTIESFDKVTQAQVAQVILEQAGISSHLENETIISLDWFFSNAVGGVRLQVAEHDVAQAVRVLTELKEDRIKQEASMEGIKIVCLCKSCKKVVCFDGKHGGRVENCPKCSRFVDVPTKTDESLEPDLVRRCLDREKEATGKSLLSNHLYVSFEVFLVLCFAYFRDLSSAITFYLRSLLEPSLLDVEASFVAQFLWARSTLVLVLIAPFLMAFGIPRMDQKPDSCSWLKFLGEAIGLTIAMMAVAGSLHFLAPTGFGMVVTWPNVHDERLIVSYVLAIIANSVAEELIMRAYLIDRLSRLFGNKLIAIGCSAFLFGSYHLYQGFWSGFVGASLMGLVLGAYFVRTRRILPLVIAHSAYNLGLDFLFTT